MMNSYPLSGDDHSAPTSHNYTLRRLQHQTRSSATLCKLYSEAQLIGKLNELNNKAGGLYGGFTRRYMAFTWKQAQQFPNLVSSVSIKPQNGSAIYKLPDHEPSQTVSMSSASNCHIYENGLKRMCSACPAITFLGSDKIPSYINEVTCGETTCAWDMGLCKAAVMLQQFLYKTGRCDPTTGYEEILPYTQEIRVCCECLLVLF